MFFLQSHSTDLKNGCIIIAAHLQDGNHWVLVMLDTNVGTFLYLDPLIHKEEETGNLYLHHFEMWLRELHKHDSSVKRHESLALRIVEHARQRDGRNCGIWTMWFAKSILSGSQIQDCIIGYEGGMIASEIMDASEDISNLCAKCGNNLNLQEDIHSIKVCKGNCTPRRNFHRYCVPESQRTRINFKCEVCDNSNRDDKCYECGKTPEGIIVTCTSGTYSGCTRFIHKGCLPDGSTDYRCGICTVRVY